jgi:hypothetical protein
MRTLKARKLLSAYLYKKLNIFWLLRIFETFGIPLSVHKLRELFVLSISWQVVPLWSGAASKTFALVGLLQILATLNKVRQKSGWWGNDALRGNLETVNVDVNVWRLHLGKHFLTWLLVSSAWLISSLPILASQETEHARPSYLYRITLVKCFYIINIEEIPYKML